MEQQQVAIIGDVGGTNIRLELVAIDYNSVITPKTIKK